MILKVFNDESKENLYPQGDGELPVQFSAKDEAEQDAARKRKLFEINFEVVSAEIALTYPIPKRW
jgi:hypothetical protein